MVPSINKYSVSVAKGDLAIGMQISSQINGNTSREATTTQSIIPVQRVTQKTQLFIIMNFTTFKKSFRYSNSVNWAVSKN
jgi:hypothetical protein